jgi:alkylation response protein AidB-like acyl-CoA dehydrogenase
MVLGFEPADLTPEELALQAEVREFLAAELPPGSFTPALGMVGGWDPEFSRKLGARGWLGMAIPREYGGGERSAVDRFVVTEELLRWGAPVEYHWVADRQTAPMFVRFGTEEQRQRFLPPICRGELSFSIGMSEPDAGSDLAAVATRGTRVDGGWLVNGTKVWTSGAQHHDWFVVLTRTGEDEDRHRGLTQLIVDLRSDGVEVHAIPLLDGSHEFNEVVLTDVFVPDDLVLGDVGGGWAQVTSELSYERGGPERWLSPFSIVVALLRERPDLPGLEDLLGDAVAKWTGLRRLSLAVARMIDEGRPPAAESGLVKEMATRFEQDLIERLRQIVGGDLDPESSSPVERLLAKAILTSPTFTIRGGTNEVLRSVIARGLRS